MPVSNPRDIQTEAGVATAEEGHVILDGPDGIAVTMTAAAALETGHHLISAAEAAQEQKPDDEHAEPSN